MERGSAKKTICAYLIKAGGMSLFMIWSSVVCTVSFPTWRTQIIGEWNISLKEQDISGK